MRGRREAMCATMKQGETQPPTAAKRASSQPVKRYGAPRLRVSYSNGVHKSHSGSVPYRCREQPKEHALPLNEERPRMQETEPRTQNEPARKRRRPRARKGPARTCPKTQQGPAGGPDPPAGPAGLRGRSRANRKAPSASATPCPPAAWRCSTLGEGGLNCRVRDGTG